MPPLLDLSVSIVTYNSEESLPSLFSSLQAQEGIDWELFLVDNASSDRTAAILRERGVENLIQNAENAGFGRAHNQNLGRFRGRYLLFLNPDVQLPRGLFAALVRFLDDHPGIAAAGPAVLEGPLQRPFLPRRFYPGEAFIPLLAELDRTEPAWINGCCLAIRRDVFTAAGGFDPDYFVYMEEVDLCWRVRQAGYRIGWLNDYQVLHRGRGSQGELSEYEQACKLFSGAVLFWEKRYSAGDRAALLRFQVGGAAILLAFAKIRGRPRPPGSRLSPARLRARRDVCRVALRRQGRRLCWFDARSLRILLRLARLLAEWVRRGGRLPLDDV